MSPRRVRQHSRGKPYLSDSSRGHRADQARSFGFSYGGGTGKRAAPAGPAAGPLCCPTKSSPARTTTDSRIPDLPAGRAPWPWACTPFLTEGRADLCRQLEPAIQPTTPPRPGAVRPAWLSPRLDPGLGKLGIPAIQMWPMMVSPAPHWSWVQTVRSGASRCS